MDLALNGIKILNKKQLNAINFEEIPVNEYWNNDEKRELLMHKIHIYPAKFPAFIAQKAFDYAKSKKMQLNLVCDIFCGCGTVALEARRHNINFLGFDINPIAAIISRAKGNNYDIKIVEGYFNSVLESYNCEILKQSEYDQANERLKYWFFQEQYDKLYAIKNSIDKVVDNIIYNNLFRCLFSSILKPCSKWLSKSIKPQVDPNKKCANPIDELNKNYKRLLKSLQELENYQTNVTIENKSILDNDGYNGEVDFIITSPPYVTSYEYADLHQLSSLWLGFTEDYTELRKDSIGSLYNLTNFEIGAHSLNNTANEVVSDLINKNKPKAKSVARYYKDMGLVIARCKNLLKEKGRILFVIGDTEYKRVKMQNAKFICEELLDNGFIIEMVCRRNISNKYLTPYRSEDGKFSNNKLDKQIYSKEFIVIGRKK